MTHELEVIARGGGGTSRYPPLLFIHGSGHAAWCWAEHFLDYFADRGFDANALSLRGHGGSNGRDRLRWTSIADYVEDVEPTRPWTPCWSGWCERSNPWPGRRTHRRTDLAATLASLPSGARPVSAAIS